MQYKITGNDMQMVVIQISPGEKIFAEAGAMIYMTGNVGMNTSTRGTGMMGGIKRKLMGESFFFTEFETAGGDGVVAFSGAVPGTIKPMDISPGREFMLQKTSFLCAEDGIKLEMSSQKKLSSAFLGGTGYFIQKLSGNGKAFIHSFGNLVEIDLAAGQSIKVDTEMVVGWDPSVSYEIIRSGSMKSSLFGGEGFFLNHLTGPGKVIVQSMTLRGLAMAMIPFMPTQRSR